MAVTISVYSRKGGIGKTTSCVNIGADLAVFEKRVLLIDADSQSHTTFMLFGNNEDFYPDGDYNAKSLYDFKDVIEKEIPVKDAIYSFTFKGHKSHKKESRIYSMDVIPGSKMLNEISVSSFQVIKETLKDIQDDYDYILIDCPPTWDIMTAAALTASDYVIVPIQSNDQFSLDGYGQTLDHINQLIESGENKNLEVLGVFLTKTKPYRKAHQKFISDIQAVSAEIRLFETGIRESEQPVINSIESNRPLCDISYSSAAAETYYSLAREIDERVSSKKR